MTTEPVGDLCDFISGLWKGEKPPFVRVNVYRNTNFNKVGTLDDNDVAELEVEAKQYVKRKLQYGDIILEKSGGGPKQPVGRVALFDKRSGEYSLSNFTSAIRVKDARKLDFNYLHRFLFWQHLAGVTETMQKRSTGIRNLNGDEYKAIRVPLPPLPEQRRIVGLLDEAFAGIATAKANTEKNLRNARSVFGSFLDCAFTNRDDTWVDHGKPLAELCEFIVDCEHKTAPTQDEGIPSIRTPNIGKGQLLLDGVYRVSEKIYREWTRRGEPRAGDLILAREAPAGNVAVIPDNLRVCLGQRTVLIRPKSSLFDSKFLAFELLRPEMQQKLLAHSRGATVQHVNMKDIRALRIGAIPKLPMQRAIVEKIAKASLQGERLESLYQQKLAALDALKKSLLHQAFTGQLGIVDLKSQSGDSKSEIRNLKSNTQVVEAVL